MKKIFAALALVAFSPMALAQEAQVEQAAGAEGTTAATRVAPSPMSAATAMDQVSEPVHFILISMALSHNSLWVIMLLIFYRSYASQNILPPTFH